MAFAKQICKTNKDGTTCRAKPTINYLDSLWVEHSTNCIVLTFDFDIMSPSIKVSVMSV